MNHSLKISNLRRGASIFKTLLRLFLALLLILGAGVLVLMFLAEEEGQTRRVVVVETLNGLSVGDRVQSEGRRIGTVSSISLDDGIIKVELELEPAFATAVPTNPEATIVADGTRPAYMEIQVLEDAVEGQFDELARDGKQLASKGVESARESVLSLIESARQWADSEQAQELRGQIDGLQADLQEMSREGGEKAKESLERAMEKGRELTADLKEKGRDDLAGQLQQSLDDLKNRVAGEGTPAELGEQPQP